MKKVPRGEVLFEKMSAIESSNAMRVVTALTVMEKPSYRGIAQAVSLGQTTVLNILHELKREPPMGFGMDIKSVGLGHEAFLEISDWGVLSKSRVIAESKKFLEAR